MDREEEHRNRAFNPVPALGSLVPQSWLGGAGGQTLLGSGFLGGLLPGMGVAAGGLTGLLQAQGAQGLTDRNRNLSAAEHAALFPLTGGFSLAERPIKNLFRGGNPRKGQRDALRNLFGEALGTRELAHTQNEAGAPEDLYGEAVALADPIAEAIAMQFPAMSGGVSGVREDAAALIANHISAGSANREDLQRKLFDLVNRLGISPDHVRSGVARSVGTPDSGMDLNRFISYANTLSRLTGNSPQEEQNLIFQARRGGNAAR